MFQLKVSRICEGQLSRCRDHNKVVKYGKKVESWHMERQLGGIRINKFLTQLDLFSVGIYGTDNKQSKFLLLTKTVVHVLGAKGECSPLINFYLVIFSFAIHYTIKWRTISVEFSARLDVFFFFISVFVLYLLIRVWFSFHTSSQSP